MALDEVCLRDYEWLFSIAKAHGLSFANCRDIVTVELGKKLGELSRKELVEFGRRICRGAQCYQAHGGVDFNAG